MRPAVALATTCAVGCAALGFFLWHRRRVPHATPGAASPRAGLRHRARAPPGIARAGTAARPAVNPYSDEASLRFAQHLQCIASDLPPLRREERVLEGSAGVVKGILDSRNHTYQRKDTNVQQVLSLAAATTSLVARLRQAGLAVCVLELGAGKALLGRAIYELCERSVRVVALDNRRLSDRKARMKTNYDPDATGCEEGGQNSCRPSSTDGCYYARMVADIADLDCAGSPHLEGVVTVGLSKHLCGSATDVALRALCANAPSDGRPQASWAGFVGAVCMAPCCHQKARLKDYCNREYLQSLGFNNKHVWRTLTSLIQLSRHTSLEDHEYRKWSILRLLPFDEVRQLGRIARRILEEGRLRYLRQHGFNVRLVEYVDAAVTPDNLAIIGGFEPGGHVKVPG